MKPEIKQRIAQLNRGEVPDGYKKTNFGVFPCDWVTDKKLKDIGSFGKGRGIPGDKMQSEGIPCVGYGDIYMKCNHFHFENAQSFVDKETACDSQLIKKGTLLFTGTGETADEIGKCVCYNGDEDIYAGGDIITFVPDRIAPLFMAYQQYQPFSLRKKASFGQGHSVVHIQKENLEKLSVAYPPSSQEQSRIAEILMKWDEAIELYQQQIEQLNKLKRAALVNLFPQKGQTTPKRRFAGFTDPWEQRKVGDYCDMFNGDRSSKYPNAQDMVSDGIPFINTGDLEDGHVNLVTCNKITREKYDDLGGAKLQLGDIVYCLRGTLGKNAYIDNFNEGTVASSLVALRPKDIDGRYLFHVLNSDIEYKQRVVHDEGAAQPNLSAKSVSEFIMPVPDIEEQKKISEFLDGLNNLITLHQRKVDTVAKQRAALQQYLLNGIVRVNI